MAEDKDFNDALEEIFLSENTLRNESYKEGYRAGCDAGSPEGYHLGYHRGAEIGREIGYYFGIVTNHLDNNNKSDVQLSDKVVQQLEKVQKLIEDFPRTNSEQHDILALLETNCHMVEFFNEQHWEKLLPKALRQTLDDWDLNYSVEKFWTYASEKNNNDDCELRKWVHKAQAHSLTVNNEYCISIEKLQEHVNSWGGVMPPEIKVKEFMTSKKSYEVQRMSRFVASLYNATKSTHCLEAGGGKGHLLVALTLGYNIPSLTVDCDRKALKNASERVRSIQKKWRAIAKKVINGNEECADGNTNSDIHRFATAFVTKDTDVSKVVKDAFPEHFGEDMKILLTGLHTCGNLGPDSLRIFAAQPSTGALFNVPCCYHLLTEEVDAGLFDVFQRDYGSVARPEHGFPMSEYLRGYNLGRNARMLAAQSIDRVVHHRQFPSKSLLYRALFQLIVKRHKPGYIMGVGKLKKMKLERFGDYFVAADRALGVGLCDVLPDGFLAEVSKDAELHWRRVVLFYLLRLCLAQVVEGVVLLDRLLYLMENGFERAFLVRLFEPVLSPRCHSIVAVR
ncbi:unnamed protein product, partial [Iphiclides podalirius]